MASPERLAPDDGLDVLTTDMDLPPSVGIRQELDGTDIGSIPDAIAREFAKPGTGDQIQLGHKVALTSGSHCIRRIVRANART